MEINGRQCIKYGKTKDGKQRYRDTYTKEVFIVETDKLSKGFKLRCVFLYINGLSLRRLGKIFNVSHVSIYNWVNLYITEIFTKYSLSNVRQITDIEVYEMFTYIGKKRQNLYLNCC
jgi:transposase-like protein